jgi:hypothetical protein
VVPGVGDGVRGGVGPHVGYVAIGGGVGPEGVGGGVARGVGAGVRGAHVGDGVLILGGGVGPDGVGGGATLGVGDGVRGGVVPFGHAPMQIETLAVSSPMLFTVIVAVFPRPSKSEMVYVLPALSLATSSVDAYLIPSPSCVTTVTWFPPSTVPLLIPDFRLKFT